MCRSHFIFNNNLVGAGKQACVQDFKSAPVEFSCLKINIVLRLNSKSHTKDVSVTYNKHLGGISFPESFIETCAVYTHFPKQIVVIFFTNFAGALLIYLFIQLFASGTIHAKISMRTGAQKSKQQTLLIKKKNTMYQYLCFKKSPFQVCLLQYMVLHFRFTLEINTFLFLFFQADNSGRLLHESGWDDSLCCHPQSGTPLGGLHHSWSSWVDSLLWAQPCLFVCLFICLLAR